MAKQERAGEPVDNEKKYRTSFNIQLKLVKKAKSITAAEGTDMSAIISDFLEGYVAKYEKQHGPVNIK